MHTQRYKPTKNYGDKCSRCGKFIKAHHYGRGRGLYCKASDAKASFKKRR